MPPRPQRRDDNEDVGTNERLLYFLPAKDIDFNISSSDVRPYLSVERARHPRDDRSGYHNRDSDYMASSIHQHSQCDALSLTVPTPTIPRPYKDLGGTPWTDSEQWVPTGQSIHAKRKTGMPFDRKTRDASQPYTKAEFNRSFEQSSVKGHKASHASSGKLSLASLRVIQSYLTEIDRVIRPNEGQIDKVYLECRRLKSLLRTLVTCCDQEPTHE
jgi:hypothetical protein